MNVDERRNKKSRPIDGEKGKVARLRQSVDEQDRCGGVKNCCDWRKKSVKLIVKERS